MSDHRTYDGAIALRPRSIGTPARCPAEPDDLRTRAARYRRLAETLVDPRVIAVVQACAFDLESEAILNETAAGAFCVVSAVQGRC